MTARPALTKKRTTALFSATTTAGINIILKSAAMKLPSILKSRRKGLIFIPMLCSKSSREGSIRPMSLKAISKADSIIKKNVRKKSIRRNFRSADARFIFYAFYASGQMFVATISTPVPSMFAQTTSPILTGALISSFAISLTQSLTLSFGTAFADLTGTTG